MNTMGNMFNGQGGIANILNNPMFQNMAQQMMNNPQMMNMATNLMNNPDAMNLFKGESSTETNQDQDEKDENVE